MRLSPSPLHSGLAVQGWVWQAPAALRAPPRQSEPDFMGFSISACGILRDGASFGFFSALLGRFLPKLGRALDDFHLGFGPFFEVPLKRGPLCP